MKRCKSCDGTFEPRLPDGTRYFHACPPVLLVTVNRAGVDVEIPLPDVQPTDLLYVRRAGVEIAVLPASLRVDDEHVRRRVAPRPDARDENVRVVGHTASGSAQTAVKAEGLGVEDV